MRAKVPGDCLLELETINKVSKLSSILQTIFCIFCIFSWLAGLQHWAGGGRGSQASLGQAGHSAPDWQCCHPW